MLYYYALVDADTGALLTIHESPSVILFLNECMKETALVMGINHSHIVGPPWLSRIVFRQLLKNPYAYAKWRWNRSDHQIVRARAEDVTKQLVEQSKLATAKARALNIIMSGLNGARRKTDTGVFFQTTVYLHKKLQAETFKNAGYPEEKMLEYPYVLQYADYAGIPLKQAAEEILFKAKLTDEHLAKTELLRMKFFNALKRAKNVRSVTELMEAFERESYLNAKV